MRLPRLHRLASVFIVAFGISIQESVADNLLGRREAHRLENRANSILEGKEAFTDDELRLSAYALLNTFDQAKRPENISRLLADQAQWRTVNNLILESRARKGKMIYAVLGIASNIDQRATTVLALRHLQRGLAAAETEFVGRTISWMNDNGVDHCHVTTRAGLLDLFETWEFGNYVAEGPSHPIHHIMKTYLARAGSVEEAREEIGDLLKYMDDRWDRESIKPGSRRGDPFGTRALFERKAAQPEGEQFEPTEANKTHK